MAEVAPCKPQEQMAMNKRKLKQKRMFRLKLLSKEKKPAQNQLKYTWFGKLTDATADL